MGAALAFALVGGGESGGSILRWDEDPTTAHPPGLPNDRIVFGAVRNTTLRRIDALATDFEVRDANGRKLEATVRFMGSFAHGLYPAFQPQPDPPESELRRLGIQVELEAGATSPLSVAYRTGPDTELPAELYYRGITALDLPEEE